MRKKRSWREVDPTTATKVSEPYEIEAWTKFTFPAAGTIFTIQMVLGPFFRYGF